MKTVPKIEPKVDDFEYLGAEESDECFMSIASGNMGAGKTYFTKQLLIAYAKHFVHRIVFIFDPNDEGIWHSYKAIYFDITEVMNTKKERNKGKNVPLTRSELNIQKVTTLAGLPWQRRIVRISPFLPNGQEMNPIQKRATMICIFENFRRGIIFLEDINKYIMNFEANEVISNFKAMRHKSTDVFMHCQSLNPLRPIHYEAMKIVRIHHDRFDANRMKSKLAENYEVVKIAQLIVNPVYQKQFLPTIKKKSEAWHLANSYHVFIDFDRNQITGCTQEQFMFACEEFVHKNPAVLRDIEMELAFKRKRKTASYEDRIQASKLWVQNSLASNMWGGEN